MESEILMSSSKEEMRSILKRYHDQYRQKPYGELLRLQEEVLTEEVKGMHGAEYSVEIYAFWDDKKAGNLRVRFAIDERGTLTQYLPLSMDFIIAPDGRFIGE